MYWVLFVPFYVVIRLVQIAYTTIISTRFLSEKAPQYDDHPVSERNAGMTYFGRQGNRCKSQSAGVEVEVFCFSRDSWAKVQVETFFYFLKNINWGLP